ncbi:MAG: hypothetical protein IPN32_08390 [Deltaproteobacteria bacterium]|nr:hypothetical protein [Deltaproteobacteria bacterium]
MRVGTSVALLMLGSGCSDHDDGASDGLAGAGSGSAGSDGVSAGNATGAADGSATAATSDPGGTSEGSSEGSGTSTTGNVDRPLGCNPAERPLSPSEQMLVDMPADSWLRIPQGYRAVCDDTFELEWHLVEGCSAVINDWSGGAWDPGRRQMLLWGGGHGGYAGNEVYGFDVPTFTWSRLTEPSHGPYDRDPLDDGQPVSRHTYNGLVWIDHLDQMLAWGGSRAIDGVGTNVTWLFDPASTTWVNPPGTNVPGPAYDASLVYDPASQHVFVKVPGGPLYELDPDTNAWTLLNDMGHPPYWPRYYGGNPGTAIDPNRGLVWFVGGGQYLVWDIAAHDAVTNEWVTTGAGMFDNGLAEQYPEQAFTSGGGDVILATDPGFAYDPTVDQMVAWLGGGPYVLDLATKAWTRKSGTDAPVDDLAYGSFGRWRYLCEYNVFILVNSMDDVYFYKHTAGA